MHPMIFFAGLLAVLFAIVLYLVKRATFAQYLRAQGVITELIERPGHTDDKQDIKFTPRIAFRTAQGTDIDFVPRAAFIGRMQVGDTLPLLYEAKNPQNAVIDGFLHRHLTEIVVLVLGVAAASPYMLHAIAG
jgi:hypothetical protein